MDVLEIFVSHLIFFFFVPQAIEILVYFYMFRCLLQIEKKMATVSLMESKRLSFCGLCVYVLMWMQAARQAMCAKRLGNRLRIDRNSVK